MSCLLQNMNAMHQLLHVMSAHTRESHTGLSPIEGSHTVPVNQTNAQKFNFHLSVLQCAWYQICEIVFPENEMNLASAVHFLFLARTPVPEHWRETWNAAC